MIGVFDVLEGIADIIRGDTIMQQWCTGGVHTRISGYISRETTPEAFDSSGALKPCIFVSDVGDYGIPPHEDNSRLLAKVYLYQQFGFGQIALMAQRTIEVLHKNRFEGVYDIEYLDQISGRDISLDCDMIVVSFEVIRRRK